MKKLFLISVVTTGLFSSCVQSESIVPELDEAANEIRYRTMVAKQNSRAIINGTTYGEGSPTFGTYAYINPNSNLPGSQSYIRNAEIEYKKDLTNPSNSYWGVVGDTKYQWPKTGSVTFYSYSPFRYQEDGEGTLTPSEPQVGQHGFIFTDYDVDAHQQTDLMVADPIAGQTANTNYGGFTGVPTVFRHKLAMISEFVLTTSQDYDGNWDGVNNHTAKAGDMRFKIWEIKLKNVATIGTYTSEGLKGTDGTVIPGGWTEPATQVYEDYVWFSVYDDDPNTNLEDGVVFGHVATKKLHITLPVNGVTYHSRQNPTIANGYLLVRPQKFSSQSDASIIIDYTIGTFNGQEWEITAEHIIKEVKLADIHKSVVEDAQGGQTVRYDGGWDMNKKIVYTLDFSTTEIRWAPGVVDWETSNFTVDY